MNHDITISGDPQDPTVTIPIDQEQLDYIMTEPLVRDLMNPETRRRLVEKHLAHRSPEERERTIAELDEDAGNLPVLTDEQWDELEHGDPITPVLPPTDGWQPSWPVHREGLELLKGNHELPKIRPSRRGDERRKVRWVTSREGRSKYAPHAGAKELAKIVARDTSDLL